MKFLIASDIHGSKEASRKLVSLDKEYNFKKIILLGDIGYSGARNIPPLDYYPIDVFKNLELIKDKLLLIRGNCDSRVDEFVLKKKFYNKYTLNLKNHRLILTHGDLYDENSFNFKENDIFLYGHTHVYRLEKIDNHLVLNPGSMSLPKVNKEKTYMIMDFKLKTISLYNLDDQLLKSIDF